ncbi:PucR family transcriptional regulator [Jatrophihabitans sp. DSM 45814]
MRELIGRLPALDSPAGEGLRVIAYFDTLLDGRVGFEAFLRGAAALTGVPVGMQNVGGRSLLRVDADGRPAPGTSGAKGWPSHEVPEVHGSVSGGGLVWLERTGEALASDALVLERLARALAATLERTQRHGPAATELIADVLDQHQSTTQRSHALTELRLNPDSPLRVLALYPADLEQFAVPDQVDRRRSVELGTSVGTVRALLVMGDSLPTFDRALRVGVGRPVVAARAFESWQGALVALRLTHPGDPHLNAQDLGAAEMLASGIDESDAVHPDVLCLRRLDIRMITTLETFTRHDSVRAVAASLGVHHSTVQARLTTIREHLGYDPTTPLGRARLHLALVALRLTDTRDRATLNGLA